MNIEDVRRVVQEELARGVMVRIKTPNGTKTTRYNRVPGIGEEVHVHGLGLDLAPDFMRVKDVSQYQPGFTPEAAYIVVE